MFSVWYLVRRAVGLLNVGQGILFLPLVFSTLGRPAFLILSLLLTVQSFIHCTLLLAWRSSLLPFLQMPVYTFLLLLCFNLFSPKDAHPYLSIAASLWGSILGWFSPAFFIFEALSSLIIVQSLGRQGRRLIDRDDGESWQIGLLIGSAAAYVVAAWWIVASYPWTATTPLSSTLFGVALSSFVFLTSIGFALRRTNVIESSGMALFLAYNFWLCADTSDPRLSEWPSFSSSYPSLLDNVLPQLQTLLLFVKTAIPKPTLIALFYRLSILHFAGRILPTIGDDHWESEGGVDNGWDGRPSSKLADVILTYRQTIFTTVYSHLLLLDHSQQVWWRWASVFFTLVMWALELVVTPEGDDLD